jgi:hypothetical protein
MLIPLQTHLVIAVAIVGATLGVFVVIGLVIAVVRLRSRLSRSGYEHI